MSKEDELIAWSVNYIPLSDRLAEMGKAKGKPIPDWIDRIRTRPVSSLLSLSLSPSFLLHILSLTRPTPHNFLSRLLDGSLPHHFRFLRRALTFMLAKKERDTRQRLILKLVIDIF